MEFFRIRRDIPVMRYAVVLNVISALTFAAAVFFIATRGLHFSVEFTGGTLVEVAYPQTAELSRVRETVDAMKLGDIQVQNFGSSRDVLIRLFEVARSGAKCICFRGSANLVVLRKTGVVLTFVWRRFVLLFVARRDRGRFRCC